MNAEEQVWLNVLSNMEEDIRKIAPPAEESRSWFVLYAEEQEGWIWNLTSDNNVTIILVCNHAELFEETIRVNLTGNTSIFRRCCSRVQWNSQQEYSCFWISPWAGNSWIPSGYSWMTGGFVRYCACGGPLIPTTGRYRGLVSGLIFGASTGNQTGQVLDTYLIHVYRCHHCHKITIS